MSLATLREEQRPVSGPLAIAATLKNRIVSGAYGYGEKMPTERQMASAFGTSRATLREALRLLEQGGLILRRVGSGTYAIYQPTEADAPPDDDVADITSPLELVELRAAVEPRMVKLAVLNMSSKDIAALGQAIEALEAAGSDAERFSQADMRFHQSIADGTRNPLFAAIYRQINHVRRHVQWNTIKGTVLTPERIGRYNLMHRQIYDAIRARDVEAACRVIDAHMDEARNDLLRGGAR